VSYLAPTFPRTVLLVYPPALPFGDGGDEFAAEVGDVGDDAAPDEVEGGRETLNYVYAAFSSGACMVPLLRLVCLLVWYARRQTTSSARPGHSGWPSHKVPPS
jgi:hypothetical protein